MQCECDDTIDDPKQPSRICSKHFAWLERTVLAEREECAKLCDAAFNDSRHGLEACSLADHLAGMIRLRSEASN